MTKKATPAQSDRSWEHKVNIPELLAPAGSFEKLASAVHYGADAIYCGGKKYSLRAHATNFSDRELKKVVAYAHRKSVKVYVTVNVIAHNEDFKDLPDYLLFLSEINIDGIILADPGILSLARKTIPQVPIHLSTQANVTNSSSALFWQKQGASRLNVARELDLSEIAAIKKVLSSRGDTQVEVFVHGALCISYSGRCMLSSYLTGRDANRGECAQPCRYRYTLMEEKRPEQYFPVEEDNRGTYIFNAKDLCLLNMLPALVASGVDSLKIEGRMKSAYYVGSVVRVYRAALDFIKASLTQKAPLPAEFMKEISKVGTRGLSENFLNGPPSADDMIYATPRITQNYIPAGIVRTFNKTVNPGTNCSLEVEFRNPVDQGEELEYLDHGLKSISFELKKMCTKDGEPRDRANPGDILWIQPIPYSADFKEYGLLRKQSNPKDS